MKLIRQVCSRCQVPISYKNTNIEKGVYTCTSCDVVGSIYEDRLFTPPAEVSAHKKVEHYIMANTLYINMKASENLPIRGRIGIVLLISILLALFSTIAGSSISVNGSPVISPLITVALWVLVVILFVTIKYAILDKRKIQFNIDPYSLEIYQMVDGERVQPNEFSIESFMVDQLYIKEKHILRNEETSKRSDRKFYELWIAGKDHEQHALNILNESRDSLLHIANLIEAYLGIQNRKISNEE